MDTDCRKCGPLAKYREVIHHILEQRNQGLLAAGDRLPSLRAMASRMGLGLNTVIRAYQELEADGAIQAVNRSGYILQKDTGNDPNPPGATGPEYVDLLTLARDVMAQAGDPGLLPLGSAHPSVDFPAIRRLYGEIARAAREQPQQPNGYQLPPGNKELRKHLGRISLQDEAYLPPDDILVTQGAQQAISISLQAVTTPGDIVLVNAPCYFGTLLSLEALQLRVIEIPTDPVRGMDINALKQALNQWPVRALLLNPTVNNPAGYSLDEDNRRAIMAATGDLPIIEDDCFSLLHGGQVGGREGARMPPALKSLDEAGRVIYCSSLSKCLDSRIRLGWVAAGRYQDEVAKRLMLTGLGGVNLIQLGLARFLGSGQFRRHLDKVRRAYQQRALAVRRHLVTSPGWQGRISHHEGGFLLWITLPPGTDGDLIYRQALAEKISITPGSIFSTTGRSGHFIRLNIAHYEENRSWKAGLDCLARIINANCP